MSASPPDDGRSARWHDLNRKLHGMVGHDPLHGWTLSRGGTSFSEESEAALGGLYGLLTDPTNDPNERRPNERKIDQFISRYLPPQDAAQAALTDADLAEIRNDPERWGQ